MKVAALHVSSDREQVTGASARGGPKVGRGLRTSRAGLERARPKPEGTRARLVGDASPYRRATITGRRLRGRAILVFALLLALAASCPLRTRAADTKALVAPAPSPVAPSAPSYDTFRTIAEQNIFNPNRVGRSLRAARSEVARPVGDSITFVGTMEYEKGYFAFFDSPNAKFRNAVRQGGTIADFTVKQVTANSVELTHGNQTLSLQIAQQLIRAEGADWVVSAAPVRTDTPAAVVDGSASTTTTAPAIPADASETLKRLMEQRQKQLKE